VGVLDVVVKEKLGLEVSQLSPRCALPLTPERRQEIDVLE